MNAGDHRDQVIVVGGGYAGIAAAVELAGHGVSVTLLEARRTWGGRATSWLDPRYHEVVDNGQHIWLGCYSATRVLLRRLGTADRIAFAPGFEITWAEFGGRQSRFRAMHGRMGWALGFLRLGRVPLAECMRLARALDSGPPPPGATVEEWLDALDQGPWSRRFFWRPLAEAAINVSPARAPAALLHRVLAEAFASPAGTALGIPRAGLAELVAPVVDVLASQGGRARLGAPVRELRASGSAGFEVVLESDETLAADAVVLAVPAIEARTLLADALPDTAYSLDDAASVPGSPIVTVTLWFDRRVLPAPLVGLVPMPAGGGPGFGFVFDRRAFIDGPADRWPVVLVASAAGGLAELPARDVVERARLALEGYGLTRATPFGSRVVKEPRATPAFTPATQSFRPAATTARPGLAVAGDWTDTGLPATLESAVRSGRTAARAVLDAVRARSAILRAVPAPEGGSQ